MRAAISERAGEMGRTTVRLKSQIGAVPLESSAQKAFFEYLKTVACPQHPKMTLFDVAYAIPNGQMIAGDARQRARYMNFLKAQGLKPGIPDVCIAYPIGRYHGAYIEMKRTAKSPVSAAQKEWLALVASVGYYTAVAAGFEAAVAHTKVFLKG
jgi:hypothetical protein